MQSQLKSAIPYYITLHSPPPHTHPTSDRTSLVTLSKTAFVTINP